MLFRSSLRNLFGSYSKYDNTNKFIVKNNTNIISNDKNSVLASDFLSLDDKSNEGTKIESSKKGEFIEFITASFSFGLWNYNLPTDVATKKKYNLQLEQAVNNKLKDLYYYSASANVIPDSEIDNFNKADVIKQGFDPNAVLKYGKYYYDYSTELSNPIVYPSQKYVFYPLLGQSDLPASITPYYNFYDKDFEKTADNSSYSEGFLYDYNQLYHLLLKEPEQLVNFDEPLFRVFKLYDSFIKNILSTSKEAAT